MVKTNGNICYVTDEFKFDDGEVLTSNLCNTSEENRVKFCTSLASVSRGKALSANPSVRYKALLKEASPSRVPNVGEELPGTPSRPLEFIGVRVKARINRAGDVKLLLRNHFDKPYEYDFSMVNFMNLIGRFSYIIKPEKGIDYVEQEDNGIFNFVVLTNMRALLNAGIPYDLIPYNTKEELKHFRAVKVRAPMFVFNQLVTHTALSKEARSERVVDFFANAKSDELGYPAPFDEVFWMPEEISSKELFDMLHNKSQIEIMNYLKDVKKLPKEIYQRALLEWRYKDFMLVAWENRYTWEHLFLERSAYDDVFKNWTQEQTRETVKCIKEVLFPELPSPLN